MSSSRPAQEVGSRSIRKGTYRFEFRPARADGHAEVDVVVVPSEEDWGARPESKQPGWNARWLGDRFVALRITG